MPDIPEGPDAPIDWNLLRQAVLFLKRYRQWLLLVMLIATVFVVTRKSGDHDFLEIDNAPPDHVPLTLVDGLAGTSCLVDHVVQGSGLIDLGAAMSEAGCPSEVVTLSQYRALAFLPHPTWSGSSASPLVVSLKDPVQVPVQIFVPAGDAVALGYAKDEASLADSLFTRNRVGIQFSHGEPIEYSAEAAAVIGDGCDAAAAVVAQGPALGVYDPAVVNVYYVPKVWYQGNGPWFGYTCVAESAPNIVYVGILYGTDNTLAHELGHVLALRPPFGHTNPNEFGVSKFTPRNLMWARLSIGSTEMEDSFSVGQAYRMNIEVISWANVLPAGTALTTSPRTGLTQSCLGDPHATYPCPPLDLAIP